MKRISLKVTGTQPFDNAQGDPAYIVPPHACSEYLSR